MESPRRYILMLLALLLSSEGIAQEMSQSTIEVTNPKGIGVFLHFNGKKIRDMKNQSCMTYSIYSTGILQIENRRGKKKQWSSITTNIQPNQTYALEVDKKGGLTTVDAVSTDELAPQSACYQINESLRSPIPGMSISREVERRKILEKKAKTHLKVIREKIVSGAIQFFKKLKKEHLLNEAVIPEISVAIVTSPESDGLPTYNLESSFTYSFLESEEVSMDLINYPSGQYTLESSSAANATASALKNSIEGFLSEYFEPGSEVKIRIVGSADSQTIRGSIKYNEENESLEEQYYLNDQYEKAAKLDPSQVRSVSISKAGIQTNEELAFLRSYFIRKYMDENIDELSKTRNQYIHEVKIEDEVGGQFRKVFIQLTIEDIFRNK